jgi:hypothetical protein
MEKYLHSSESAGDVYKVAKGDFVGFVAEDWKNIDLVAPPPHSPPRCVAQ